MNNELMLKLDNALSQANAGQFFSLVTHTRVGVLTDNGVVLKSNAKKYDGFPVVTKRSEFTTQAKTSYLNRAKKKDGRFELSERKWGLRLNKNLVSHNDSLYLETIHDPDSNMPKAKVTYFVDGKEVDSSSLTLPKSTPSASGINVRTFKGESIVSAKVNGQVISA